MSDLVAILKLGLTNAQFTDVSPELEWLTNITNAKTCPPRCVP